MSARQHRPRWDSKPYTSTDAHREFTLKERKRRAFNHRLKRGSVDAPKKNIIKNEVPSLYKKANNEGKRQVRTLFAKTGKLDLNEVQKSFDEGFDVVIRHSDPHKIKRTPLSPRSTKSRRPNHLLKQPSKCTKNILFKGGIERGESHFICTITGESGFLEFVCLESPSHETYNFCIAESDLSVRLEKKFQVAMIPDFVEHIIVKDGKISFEYPFEGITVLTEEEKAAVKIQAHWKGHQARQEKKQEKEAAVKIQAHWKGHKARKELEKNSESGDDASKATSEKAEKSS